MKIINALIWLSVVLVCLLPVNPDHYRFQTTLSLFFFLVFIGVQIWKRFGLLTCALFSYVIANVLYSTQWRTSPFEGFGGLGMFGLAGFEFHPKIQALLIATSMKFGMVTMENAVLHSALFFLLFWMLALALPRFAINPIFKGLELSMLVGSCYMIHRWLLGDPNPRWILDNNAMDASFLACIYPVAVLSPSPKPYLEDLKKHWKHALYDSAVVILPPIAILLSRSSTGIAAFGVSIAALIFTITGPTKRAIWPIVALAASTAAFGYLYLGPELFYPNGRAEIWSDAYDFASSRGPFFGVGLGTFWALGSSVVRSLPITVGWAHSDWVQVFFELGWVGVLLTLALVIQVAVKTYRTPWAFSGVMTLVFTAITQMPLRHGPTALLGVCLLVGAVRRD